VTIEVLYVDGCPNVPPTMDGLKRVLGENGVKSPVTLIRVHDHEAAQALRFLGSPTVRINGVDIEPSARSRSNYGLMCRTYPGSGGVPSDQLIRQAIAGARSVITP
jgi:hypothetical protein